MSDLTTIISTNRMRYMRGASWASVIMTLIYTLTFAKVWEETFVFYHIPIMLVYIGIPLCFIVACWVIGYIDETKGLWKAELTYANNILNKEFTELCHEVNETKEILIRIEQQINKDDKKHPCYSNNRLDTTPRS